MHRVGTADRRRRRLAEAEVAHLARRDQLRHRADGLLDRHVRIDAVLVEEVDVVRAEALQRSLDTLAHVLGRAVDRAERRKVAGHRVGPDVAGELGRDHIVLAMPLDGVADEHLIGHRAVQLRGIEEVDADLERMADRRRRLVLVGRAVERRHSHAAQPEGGHLERAKLACLHC